MSDVAFISGLDQSTISRLWDDPHWLDRVKGHSLQALVASVPGVAEYFASHSVLTRRNKLIGQLEAEGLRINHGALRLPNAQNVPHQYLINALEAALSIMQGDGARTCALIARFWGVQQNQALEALYSPASDTSLLHNPEELFSASVDIISKLNSKTYSFHAILTKAAFSHHLSIATGELPDNLRPENYRSPVRTHDPQRSHGDVDYIQQHGSGSRIRTPGGVHTRAFGNRRVGFPHVHQGQQAKFRLLSPRIHVATQNNDRNNPGNQLIPRGRPSLSGHHIHSSCA